jgi:predicted MFS family arabinose efflux permease
MAVGISMLLFAVSETSVWGWGSVKTIGLLAAGVAVCALWIAIEVRSAEPLVDMTMMRIRGVWTTNLAAFLLGAGMYASFIIIPQFAQLPKRTGFGYGASVVVSGLYLLPATMGMMAMSMLAGTIALRYGSRRSLISGSAVSTAAFVLLLVLGHGHVQMLVAAGLIGIGIGLAFAALGNLIVGAVPPQQTGIASGMNTVMRLLGGAVGGQLSATFIAGHVFHGLPAVGGFTETFAVSAAFLALCVGASLLVPRIQSRLEATPTEPRAPARGPVLAGVGDGAAEAVNS